MEFPVHSDRQIAARPNVVACEPAGAADLNLRPARQDDALLLWFWSHDVEARHNAINPQPIAWRAHEEGYRELLAAAHTRIWLLEFRGVAAGKIRYSRGEGSNADIHLFVLPRFRRRGMGSWLLDATVNLAGTGLGVSRVRATIFADNEAGRSTFLRARFSALEEILIAGRDCLTLQRSSLFEPVGKLVEL